MEGPVVVTPARLEIVPPARDVRPRVAVRREKCDRAAHYRGQGDGAQRHGQPPIDRAWDRHRAIGDPERGSHHEQGSGGRKYQPSRVDGNVGVELVEHDVVNVEQRRPRDGHCRRDEREGEQEPQAPR
jgi:hypothetical protein